MVKRLGLTQPAILLGALGSRASVIFDLDNDGDLDIVSNEFNDAPMVLVSNLTDKKAIRYLKVKLVGSRSNRSGLGARIKIWCGSEVYTKVHDGQSGYLSQSDMPLYFGIGDAQRVDRIEVHWPSGLKQTIVKDIEINKLLVIQEPAS